MHEKAVEGMVVNLGELKAAVRDGAISEEELAEIADWMEENVRFATRIPLLARTICQTFVADPPECTREHSHDFDCIAERIKWAASCSEIGDRNVILAQALLTYKETRPAPAAMRRLQDTGQRSA